MKVFLLGRPKSGKTECAKQLVARVLLEGIPVLAHDPRRQIPERGISWAPGVHFARAEDLTEAWVPQAPLTVVRAGDAESVDAICTAAIGYCERTRKPVLVYLDEIWPFAVDGRHWNSLGARNVAYNGRHFGDGAGVGLIALAMRPQVVDPAIWGVADRVCLFRLDGVAEQRYLGEAFGDDFAEAVGQLPMPSPTAGSFHLVWEP